MFPHLSRELDCKTNETFPSSAKGQNSNRTKEYANYQPNVIDFIRRCDNEIQAQEIVDFLERREEITHEYADELRRELAAKGVRNFGKKKERDYYLKSGRT
jgi:hypothetical protein